MENLPLAKFVVDALLMVFAVVLTLYLSHGIPPYERGFFCNDDSIKYPNLPSTVSPQVLHTFSILLPSLSIIILDLYVLKSKPLKKIMVWNYGVPGMFVGMYATLNVFLFGYMATHITTDVIKNIIGRLRPCFITICKPSIDCSLPENSGRYILPSEFECTSRDDDAIWDARKSFLSGHSSISVYAMVFLALYLHYRLKWRGSMFLRLTLQIFVILLAVMTAMTRVSNYRHHWSDVLAGMALGVIYAFVIFYLGTDVWKPKHHLPEAMERKQQEAALEA